MTLFKIDELLSAKSEIHVQVRWGELDANGHFNNIYFLRYWEEARVLSMTQWGFDIAELSEKISVP